MKTEKYFRVVVFFLMLTTYLPIITYYLPEYIGSHHFWTIVCGISLVLFKPKVFIRKIMLLIGMYALFLWIMLHSFWQSMDAWNVKLLWTELYNIAIGASIITYFQVSEDYKGLNYTVIYVLAFLVISAIMTIISSIIDPMYARNITGAGSLTLQKREEVLAMQRFGGGGYGTAIVFMAIIPLYVYYFKHTVIRKNKKWIFPFVIALTILAVIRMQVFTNIIIMGIAFLFSVVSIKNRKRTIVIIGLISVVFFLIPKRIYVDAFYTLSDSFRNLEDISFKFEQTAYYFETGGNVKETENAVAGRAERYPMLWEIFSYKPFLGCYFLSDARGNGYRGECGHLYWMNKLVVTGIVGFVFFLSIIITFIRQESKKIREPFRFYFMLSIASILLYGIFKNVGGRECWYFFFVIASGMYDLSLVNKNKTEIKTEEPINND